MTAPRELTNVRVESLSLDDQPNAWGHPPPQVVTAPTTRTDGIDFAAILGESAVRADAAERDYSDGMDDYDVIAVAVLAAKVPELCPDCQSDDEWLGMAQTGAVAWDGEPYYAECAHPNTPAPAGWMLPVRH